MLKTAPRTRAVLAADTARALMMPNPVSIQWHATVRDALALLLDRGISAAPVINNAGHPVGVLSRADILRYDREHVAHAEPLPEFYAETELNARLGDRTDEGFQVEAVDRTEVRAIMSPVVFSVPPETGAWETVQQMLELRVHRLFVVDDDGTLVGVVSALDVLRRLARE